MLDDYNSINNELDAIYDHIGGVIRISSKSDRYDHGKKSFFIVYIVKQLGVQNTIKKLLLMTRQLQTRHVFWIT